MPVRKKKKAARKVSGLAKYRAKVKKATAAVSRAIKKAESRLKALKKKKAAKVRKVKKAH
jgi:hypothetical protein